MNKFRYLFVALTLLWGGVCVAQVLTLPSSAKVKAGMWLCYRIGLYLGEDPSEAEFRIAADSKYWLWINGELQVREGGLKRGPNPEDTYCDVLRGTYGLHKGENTVAVLVWYFGKDGYSHRSSPVPGLSFSLSVDGDRLDTDDG